MSEQIQPALTPEEWAEALSDDGGYSVNDAEWVGSGPHAFAAQILHGQPFGFTWEDVEHLRLVAGQYEALRLGSNHGHVLNALADRIAALLPPR